MYSLRAAASVHKGENVKLLVAAMAAVAFVSIAPATVLAEANPNNQGNHYHYGWYKHKNPPQTPAPVPVPTPSSGGTHGVPGGLPSGVPSGVTGNLNAVPPAAAPLAPVELPPTSLIQQPSGTIVTAAEPLPSLQNVWLVAILLASVTAAAVTIAVLAAGRSSHFALRRVLAVVSITA